LPAAGTGKTVPNAKAVASERITTTADDAERSDEEEAVYS